MKPEVPVRIDAMLCEPVTVMTGIAVPLFWRDSEPEIKE